MQTSIVVMPRHRLAGSKAYRHIIQFCRWMFVYEHLAKANLKSVCVSALFCMSYQITNKHTAKYVVFAGCCWCFCFYNKHRTIWLIDDQTVCRRRYSGAPWLWINLFINCLVSLFVNSGGTKRMSRWNWFNLKKKVEKAQNVIEEI